MQNIALQMLLVPQPWPLVTHHLCIPSGTLPYTRDAPSEGLLLTFTWARPEVLGIYSHRSGSHPIMEGSSPHFSPILEGIWKQILHCFLELSQKI